MFVIVISSSGIVFESLFLSWRFFLQLVFCLFLFCLETYWVLFVLLGGVGVVPSVCLVSCEFVAVILGTLFVLFVRVWFACCDVWWEVLFFGALCLEQTQKQLTIQSKWQVCILIFREFKKKTSLVWLFKAGTRKTEYCSNLFGEKGLNFQFPSKYYLDLLQKPRTNKKWPQTHFR